jgi:hypothetical protein
MLERLHDPHPVLVRPPIVRADTLDLPADEPVLGVEVADEARAYPVSLLARHHLVNDRLGGAPLLVTFCMRCFSGVGFSPTVDGLDLTFAVFGVYQGSFTMNDELTGTIWSQLTGEALAGDLVGRRLDMLPIHMTTLGAWTERYPESTVPDVHDLPRPPTPTRLPPGASWWRSVSVQDQRLPLEALVLGVNLDGRARAYKLDVDRPGPRLFEDELDGEPIALLADPGGWPLAFSRRIRTGIVRLRLDDRDEIVDEEGSRWSGGGRAVGGPSAGAMLDFVPSRVVQWYSWAAMFPHTGVAFPLSAPS